MSHWSLTPIADQCFPDRASTPNRRGHSERRQTRMDAGKGLKHIPASHATHFDKVTGLVHDLGKLLSMFGSQGQWDVVGVSISLPALLMKLTLALLYRIPSSSAASSPIGSYTLTPSLVTLIPGTASIAPSMVSTSRTVVSTTSCFRGDMMRYVYMIILSRQSETSETVIY